MATAQHQTLGDLAQGAIAKYLKQAVAQADAVLADTDPENLHQMRVGLRRLRTAVQVFGPGLALPKAGREARVAAVGRQLGTLRDLDVIGATLRDRYAPDLPDNEQACLGEVLLALAKRRHKTFKQVKKLLQGKRYRRLTQALGDWVAEPDYGAIAPLPADQMIVDLVSPLVSQLWLHPGWLVGTKATSGGAVANPRLSLTATDALISAQGPQLHSLRKQIKRVRYQLRLVADRYPGTLDDDIQRLSTMQDNLGALQDSTVLAQFIETVVPDARAQMPRLFALLADSRHRAWKQWQSHQQHYLDPAQRQRLRLALLTPGAPAPAEPAGAKSAKAKSGGAKSGGAKSGGAKSTKAADRNSTTPASRRRSTARGKTTPAKTTRPPEPPPDPEPNDS